jgi:hypothetical protein
VRVLDPVRAAVSDFISAARPVITAPQLSAAPRSARRPRAPAGVAGPYDPGHGV